MNSASRHVFRPHVLRGWVGSWAGHRVGARLDFEVELAPHPGDDHHRAHAAELGRHRLLERGLPRLGTATGRAAGSRDCTAQQRSPRLERRDHTWPMSYCAPSPSLARRSRRTSCLTPSYGLCPRPRSQQVPCRPSDSVHNTTTKMHRASTKTDGPRLRVTTETPSEACRMNGWRGSGVAAAAPGSAPPRRRTQP